jgi:hypothetical protein
VAVAHDGESVVLGPPPTTGTVRGLWRVLYPWEETVLVPATAESHLLRHLPLPPGAGAASATERAN